MNANQQAVTKAFINGAVTGGVVLAAGSVVAGTAVVAVPVTVCFGLITIGTAATISVPIMVGSGIIGGIVSGTGNAFKKHAKIKSMDKIIEKALTKSKGG